MGRIRILDAHLANQIAAGEVVERPAAVVKELVENAIDAGGTRIAVSISQGGMQSIRVTDDGHGMDKEDLVTAFERHATSKIKHTRDLFAIRTLGFRGEALPSIAAVAKVVCRSATTDDGLAYTLSIAGSTREEIVAVPGPKGTDMTITDLFFNTPARLKHMKTVQTELAHVTDYMSRLAFAYPHLSFALTHDGQTLLQTTGQGDLRHTMAAVYGAQTLSRFLEVAQTTTDFHLHGWISPPDTHRAGRNGITLIVNGRYVRMHTVNHAIVQAYGTLLPTQRYPIGVLHMTMEPTLVDVNVHPAKLEIRCSKEGELLAAVRRAVSHTLRLHTHIPSGVALRPQKPAVFQPASTTPKRPPLVQGVWREKHAPALAEALLGQGASLALSTQARLSPAPTTAEISANTVDDQSHTAYTVPDRHAPQQRFPSLQPIGAIHHTYIVAQHAEGLYLIDQHAAHERVHYERILHQFATDDRHRYTQPMLIPQTMEFTATEHALLHTHMERFRALGVELESFGGYTWVVRAHPPWIEATAVAQTIRDMVQDVFDDQAFDLIKLRDHTAKRYACIASVKAHQPQTQRAMEQLLQQLSSCTEPFTCPHGRPTVIAFSTYDLAKMFGRVNA